MLLVTLTAIYAYRIYKNKENFNIKNWIIFAICSLASAYTHYYALMASGLINLFLMIYLIKKCIKTKEFNKNMKAFIISAISQVVLYMPWLISLFIQLNHVSSGFWIGFTFPDSIIELFIFIFTGNLSGSTYLSPTLAIIWSLSVIIYMAVLYIKDIKKSKENNLNSTVNPAILALSLFLGVALAAGIISIVMGTPIIYARYLLCVMGLFIFFLSYTMIKKGQKYITLIICIASMLISLHINIDLINENYDESNCKPVQFVEEAIQENDIILVENDLNGFIILVNFNNNPAYFYDKENWNCGEAYKAFSKDFTTIQDLEFLKDYTGRIWTINSNNNFLYEQLKEKYDVNLIKQETFDVKYKNLEYSISLIEKN